MVCVMSFPQIVYVNKATVLGALENNIVQLIQTIACSHI